MGQITLETTDGICVLTADRPPANAMDVGLLEELVVAIGELTAEPPAALVLTGRPGYFSAGMDLKLAPTYSPEQQRAAVAGINGIARGVYSLPFPVVGAINGHAMLRVARPVAGQLPGLKAVVSEGSLRSRARVLQVAASAPRPRAPRTARSEGAPGCAAPCVHRRPDRAFPRRTTGASRSSRAR